jgi:hypothetical protein
MNSVYDLLSEIRKCPQMYIGKLSLERLFAYIGGFKHHAMYKDDCLDGFTQFVANYYDINTDHNWSDYIRFFSATEEEAFHQFYRLFDEYMASKTISGAGGNLSAPIDA